MVCINHKEEQPKATFSFGDHSRAMDAGKEERRTSYPYSLRSQCHLGCLSLGLSGSPP